MTGPDIEARELTEREARRALREEFGLPPDFQDTDMGWEIEPTEAESVRKTLKDRNENHTQSNPHALSMR